MKTIDKINEITDAIYNNETRTMIQSIIKRGDLKQYIIDCFEYDYDLDAVEINKITAEVEEHYENKEFTLD
jgi:hypothetical protein